MITYVKLAILIVNSLNSSAANCLYRDVEQSKNRLVELAATLSFFASLAKRFISYSQLFFQVLLAFLILE